MSTIQGVRKTGEAEATRGRKTGEAEATPGGPIGRLGRWTAGHVRLVVIAWAILAVGLGGLAPQAEHALSGAGWDATGSGSVAARHAIDAGFAGQAATR